MQLENTDQKGLVTKYLINKNTRVSIKQIILDFSRLQEFISYLITKLESLKILLTYNIARARKINLILKVLNTLKPPSIPNNIWPKVIQPEKEFSNIQLIYFYYKSNDKGRKFS